jgi:hypothetical protein
MTDKPTAAQTQEATPDKCPTCGSDNQNIRHCRFRRLEHEGYWVSDSHDVCEPCLDPWHSMAAPQPAPQPLPVGSRCPTCKQEILPKEHVIWTRGAEPAESPLTEHGQESGSTERLKTTSAAAECLEALRDCVSLLKMLEFNGQKCPQLARAEAVINRSSSDVE